MNKIIWTVIGLIVIVGGFFVFSSYIVPKSQDDAKGKASDAMARSIQAQIAPIVELYYFDQKTVPQKMEDMFKTNPSSGQPYLSPTTPGLALVEYKYIDNKNADICLVDDSSLAQKCQRATIR